MSTPPSQKTNDIPRITKLNASHGVKWLNQGFKLYTLQLKSWLIISAFLLVLLMIPSINQIVALLFPIPVAGIMIGLHQPSDNQSKLSFEHLFCALQTHTKPMMFLCAIYALLTLAITFFTYFILQMLGYDLDTSQVEALQQMKPEELLAWLLSEKGQTLIQAYTLTLLIYLALLTPIMMAYWFAPALIVLNNRSPIEALKLSFNACKINFLAFTIYGLVTFLYLVLAFTFISFISSIIPVLSIPLILLLFLSIFAISIASIYTSYLDIFSVDNLNNNISDSGSLLA